MREDQRAGNRRTRGRILTAVLVLCAAWAAAASADGWVSPTGFEDPEGKWRNESRGYDENTGTFTDDYSLRLGWAAYIVLTMNQPVRSSRLRVNADWWLGAADCVDIDVYKDGAWVDVHEGSILNCAWDEKTFPSGMVEKVRFRYRYTNSRYIYWLYELDLYEEPAQVNAPTCETLVSSSVEQTSAILHGEVTDDGGEPCECRIVYGPTQEYGTATDWQASRVTGGYFSGIVTGLDGETTYRFRAEARNSAGTACGADMTFTTGAPEIGWLPGTEQGDPDEAWEDEASAADDDEDTCARSYHDIWAPQWGPFIHLSRAAIPCNGVRFIARQGGYIDEVDVDVLKDGSWTDVYQGTYADRQWVTHFFRAGVVTEARVRFHVNSTNCGLYWELYEFDFSMNHDPVAVEDRAETNRSIPVTVDVLANDTDEDGDTLVVTEVTDPAHGTAVINGGTTITYMPGDGYSGDEVFAYTIIDGRGSSDTAQVIVSVDSGVPTTTVYPAGGTYAQAPVVTLTANEDAIIYYTSDGSTPEAGGVTTLSGASPVTDIQISQTGSLQFFAMDPAGNVEEPQTEEYIITIYVSAAGGDDSYNGLYPSYTEGENGPKKSIRAAITAATSGTTIVVADGTYAGADNRNLDFGGKALVLRSENGKDRATIDCEKIAGSRGFLFRKGETADAIVEGFTITNANSGLEGGGMYIDGASPTIRGCLFLRNSAANGAGIYLSSTSSPSISDCVVRGNVAQTKGGGIYFHAASKPKIERCDIKENQALAEGGGVYAAE